MTERVATMILFALVLTAVALLFSTVPAQAGGAWCDLPTKRPPLLDQPGPAQHRIGKPWNNRGQA